MEQRWTITVYWRSGKKPHVHRNQNSEQVEGYKRLELNNSDVISKVTVEKERHLKIVKDK